MDIPLPARKIVLGVQLLFVAFGALVLVPLLTGLDPTIALFTAGAGTLLFQWLTRATVPVFLASSFAFIAPIQYGVTHFGISATLGGLICASGVYVLVSAVVKIGGPETLDRYLPPIVTGPVIMVIGLKLAPVAVKMARNFDGSDAVSGKAMVVALSALLTAIAVVAYGRRTWRLVPILCGIFVGYLTALAMGMVNFKPVLDAPWLAVPWVHALDAGTFSWPTFEPAAILYLAPVAIAPVIEHVGDILAIGSVTGRNYVKNPGLHRTLLGDGLATALAAALGGPPNTTYSEVTGAVALTRAFDPAYMRIAAVAAMLLAFVGKLGALLHTIPSPVMGGILILLFGMIAVVGIGALVKARVDMTEPRNMVIAAVVLVMGIGDMLFCCGRFSLSGIGLAGVVGVALNILLPKRATVA